LFNQIHLLKDAFLLLPDIEEKVHP